MGGSIVYTYLYNSITRRIKQMSDVQIPIIFPTDTGFSSGGKNTNILKGNGWSYTYDNGKFLREGTQDDTM